MKTKKSEELEAAADCVAGVYDKCCKLKRWAGNLLEVYRHVTPEKEQEWIAEVDSFLEEANLD